MLTCATYCFLTNTYTHTNTHTHSLTNTHIHTHTAAMLTWATYCLLTHPAELAAVREEVDRVLGGRPVAYADIMQLEQVCM